MDVCHWLDSTGWPGCKALALLRACRVRSAGPTHSSRAQLSHSSLFCCTKASLAAWPVHPAAAMTPVLTCKLPDANAKGLNPLLEGRDGVAIRQGPEGLANVWVHLCARRPYHTRKQSMWPLYLKPPARQLSYYQAAPDVCKKQQAGPLLVLHARLPSRVPCLRLSVTAEIVELQQEPLR